MGGKGRKGGKFGVKRGERGKIWGERRERREKEKKREMEGKGRKEGNKMRENFPPVHFGKESGTPRSQRIRLF